MSHEFSLIMQVDRVEETFMDLWGQYSQAIVNYAEATKTKSRELKHALREEDCEGTYFLFRGQSFQVAMSRG